jgi:hypothetical protein
MNRSLIFKSYLLVLLISGTMALTVHAQRVGSFEITAQPVNKESSEVTGQGSWWVDKRKSQNMVYKVRIDYKGLDPIENITVRYLVAFTPVKTSNVVEGSETYVKLSSQQKVEFETKGIENTYMQYNYDGMSHKSGKAQLRGIALRIFQGEKMIAEWSQPADIKNSWKTP